MRRSNAPFAGLLVTLAMGVSLGSAVPADAAERLNVIYIMADDLGWTDLGCQGSKYYRSPNIDRLAASGLRFTDAYTCGPNCQPTRAALMSGQYGPRTGVYTVGGIDRFDWSTRPLRPVDNVTQLPLDRKTPADQLRAVGYKTALFGKWHLGDTGDYHPSKRGFDEAIVSAGKHFDFVTRPAVSYPKGTYLADFLTERSIDFIRKNREQPFFLCLHHFGVHSPHQAKPELIKQFQAIKGVGGHSDPTYAAMIASVDESVGRIMDELDKLKIADRTLVIFSSDNGGVGGYVREGLKQSGDITDNTPLRSGKGSLYEGGTRVAWMARLPGRIPVGTCSSPIISVDLYPTLLEVAGAKPPEKQPLDGVSLLPCLLSGGKTAPDRDALYWHFPGYLGAGAGTWRTTPAGAIRMGDWKLIEFFEDGRKELYDLKADLSQVKNLAREKPEKTAELHAKLVAWREKVGAPMPKPNDSKQPPPPKKKKNKNEDSEEDDVDSSS